jgi:hypothetical protein
MKKLLALLLCAVVMLPSCNYPKEPLEIIKERLSEDCSYQISTNYNALLFGGFSQKVVNEFAQDGSFHFTDVRRQWHHGSDYDSTDTKEYYYRYENGSLVCYSKFNEDDIQRVVLGKKEIATMAASRSTLIGADGLLPSYMEDFTDKGEHSGTGLCEFTFRIPVEQEIKRESFLSSFLQMAFEWYDSEYDPETNLYVSCLLEVEKDTLHPVKLTYDFSEVKPYVLSEGTLSGEFAFDMDLMTLVFEFNYDLPETIPVPDTFKDAVAK